MADISRRLLSGVEAARRLGIAPKTLWEWVQKGIIPQVKFPGTKVKYDIKDIDKLIEKYKSFSDRIKEPQELLI